MTSNAFSQRRVIIESQFAILHQELRELQLECPHANTTPPKGTVGTRGYFTCIDCKKVTQEN